MRPLSTALSSAAGFSTVFWFFAREISPHRRADRLAHLAHRAQRAAALRRAAVEERVILQLQPANDALGQTAAAQNAVLGVVVPLRVLPEHRIVRVEIADRVGAFVANLDAGARTIEWNLRVGLKHHQTDDDDEGRAGDAAMSEDGRQAIQQVHLRRR